MQGNVANQFSTTDSKVQFALSQNGPVSASYQDSKPKFYKTFSLCGAHLNRVFFMTLRSDATFFSFSSETRAVFSFLSVGSTLFLRRLPFWAGDFSAAFQES